MFVSEPNMITNVSANKVFALLAYLVITIDFLSFAEKHI